MNIKPINTKKDYQEGLNRLEVLFYTPTGTEHGFELEVLGILIDNYDQEHHRIEYPDPIEAIKFRMEQMGHNHLIWQKS